ncbi:hypothetical protein BaRGS_00007052 [Batillaria attramentaria]|uniref:Myb-like domain-containing protein n=1 Tax=Batillaria attramentaria TaxID=370345 RepID=A0ABD0LR57_9CAEN
MEESLNARGPEGKKSVPGDNLCSAKKNDCKLNIEAGGDSDEWETDYSASSGEGAEGEAGGWDPKSEHENQLRMKTSNEMSPSKPRGRSDENKIVIKTDTEGKEKDAARVSSGPYLPEDDADMFLCSTPKKGQSHKPGGRGKQKRQRKKVVATSGAISKRRKMIESSQKSAAQKIPLFLEGADDQQDSSSSEDALCVDESAGNEEHVHIDKSVDKTIEEHAIKNNLTANNVKSILRSLITHELVQTMLRNSLASMSEDQDETVFEPKLTRSKMKQVLQKGNDTNLWPVSPAKLGRPSATGPSILDVDFTDEEDEEDDEYQPDKDAEDLESDEESVTSSQVSDIGSPAPSTPQTPRTPVRSSSSMASTPVNKSNESLASPMGPPLPPGNRPVSKLAQQFKSSMKALEDSQNEQDVIAGRTRSKLPLTATSLYDIEEAFVAPDITPDMYDTFCDDTDWQDFLKGLQKCSGSDVQNESVEIGDDEQNDPEFNYLAEAETEELDKEDFRFDKPFRIPRKELNELMEELDELFNEENEFSWKWRGTPAPPELVQVTEDQMQQIEEQMRKHVQLTCQMYVLAQGSSDYKGMAQECHKMIMELNLFRDISVVGTQSVYNVCNLVPAVELVNRDVDWDSEIRAQSENQTCPNTGSNTVSVEALSTGTGKAQQLGEASKTMLQSSEGSVRQEALPDRVVDSSQSQVSRTQNSRCSAVRAISKSSGTGLREEGSPAEDLPGCSSKKARPRSLRSYRVKLSEVQMREIWHSPVFMYPALLPTTGLLPRSVPQSVHFTLSEDRLIAIGLDQFSKLKNPASFIQRLMMPCKTVNQIKAHIKNMSAQRFVRPNNPIKYYREHGKLRAVTHLVEKFSPSMMKAPKDQPEVLLPLWCKNYRDQLRREENKRWATEQLQLLKEKSTEKRGKGRKRQKEQNSASSSSCSEDDASGENSDVPMETLETLRMKLKPRVKRHKIIMKKRQSRRDRESISGAYSSTPITVLPSTSGSPNAIITSSGIFVPIHLASPTRMNSALASTAVKPSMSSSKKVLTTHQLLGIGTCGTGRETVNEADITAALPGSLRELRDTVQKEGVSQKHAQEGMTESEGQTERSCDSCQHHMPDSSVECCDTSHQVTSQVVQDRAPVGDTAALTKIEAGGDGVSTGCNELEGNVGAVTCRSSTSEVASMDILQMAVKGILDSPVKRAIVPVLLSVGVDHSGGIVSSPAVDNLQDEEIFGTKMTTGASKITASQNVEHGENRAGDMSSCLSYSGGNCSDIPHDDQERAAHSESAEVCHSCDVTSLPVSSSTPTQTVQMLSEGCHVSSSTPAADRITWSAAETQPARPAPVRVKPAPATVPHTSWSSLSSVCATSDVEVMFPVIVSDGEDTVCSTVGVEITNTSTSTQPQGTGAPAAAAQTAAGKPQSENSVQGNFASTSFPSPSLMQAQNERSPTKSGRRMSPSLTDSPVVIQDTEVPQSSDEDIQHQPVSAALSSEVHNPQTQVSLSTSVSSLQNLAPSVFVVASSSQALSLASFSGRPTVTTPSTFSVSAIPVTPPTATQKHVLEKTSTKYSPAKRPIAPKPGPVNCSPQIDIEKRRSQRRIVSPKKQLLQQQVRAILPKGYIYEMKMTSPTKAAARSLKRKATLICQRGSPNKPLLPLTAEIAQTNVSRPVTRGLTSSLTSQIISLKVPWTRRGAHLAGKKRKPRVVEKKPAEVKTVPEPEVEDPGQDESDETASEVDEGAMLSQEDSQTEEDADGGDEEEGYVSELMAASTTIGFNPHKKFTPDKDDHRSKAEIRREQKLAVLAPDVVDIDPRKDERDTAYAQAYVNKVKLAMQKDPDTYARFMELLCQFEKQDTSPVQVGNSL